MNHTSLSKAGHIGGRLACALLLGILPLAGIAEEKQEFGSHAYMRIGGGVSDDDTQQCFKAPGAGAKYRLGNECESVVKISGYLRQQFSNDSFVHIELMPLAKGSYGKQFKFRYWEQAFVEAGDFPALGSTKFWLGRRLYDRHDIFINDYFPLNVSGDAVGVRDIPLGPGKFEYAYFLDDETPLPGNGLYTDTGILQHTHDLRLYDVKTVDKGTVLLHLQYHRISGDRLALYDSSGPVSEADFYAADGWVAGLVHTLKEAWGGTNKFFLQYGNGSARNAGTSAHEPYSVVGSLTSAGAADALEDALTVRIADSQLWDTNDWALMAAALLEYRDNAAFDGTDKTWLSLGARPMWFIDDHWRLIAELGHDRVYNADMPDVYLSKLTLALGWGLKRGFWKRPEVRLYGTFARWSESARGAVGGPLFSNDTHGWNLGLQMESFW